MQGASVVSAHHQRSPNDCTHWKDNTVPTGYARGRTFVAATEARPDWLTRGACRGEDPELHFPVKDENYAANVAKAKAMCWSCPVVDSCREYAMAAKEELGIWAGMTNAERIKLRAVSRRPSTFPDSLQVAS